MTVAIAALMVLIPTARSFEKPLPSEIVQGSVYAYCFAGDAERNTIYMTKLFAVQLPRSPGLQTEFKVYLRAHYPPPGPNTPKTWSEPGCFADKDQAELQANRDLRSQDFTGTYGVKLIEPGWRPSP